MFPGVDSLTSLKILDSMQGPDHRHSMAPRGYRAHDIVCLCVCVWCVQRQIWRARTPDMLWKCAVDRGQTGRDLLGEAWSAS
ncbi:hypothetical protein ATANTOWER_021114 [Ataeniobius toweri]|uniref:Uncharacterized protein n=1 Tax=Ataeniobius toweri TaxID=208326 RepID=A0ABU7A0X3_9TELE|nr:hypothetical protein [Ataeniobius toweri]